MSTPDQSSPQSRSLKEELAAVLPQGFQCKIRYVHTPPKPCDPLFSTPSGFKAGKTRLASHFLTVSINPSADGGSEHPNGVLVFALEALVYSTKYLTTIFVSKADSTGYLPQQRPSAIKLTTSAFLKWLAEKERQAHPRRKIVISLFARSQSQYLFPGSAENPKKHVLDDRQLIKWWARVLDPIFSKEGARGSDGTQQPQCDGYITVPGYDNSELRSLIPSNTSSTPSTRWHPGHPLIELAETRGMPTDVPPRCLLPRFPDDPKARFMQDLDDEAGIVEETSTTTSPSRRKADKWASIRDLATFWETMAFRQECSSGRLVGFLWLVIRPSTHDLAADTNGNGIGNSESQDSSSTVPSSDPVSFEEKTRAHRNPSPSKPGRKRLTGPIIPRQPRLKGASSSLTKSDLSGMLEFAAIDGLTLTADGYDKAMQTLMHLDFANLAVAGQSTNKWIADVSQIGGVQGEWALEVTGSAKTESAGPTSGGGAAAAQVNDLGGMIRKKRKAEEPVGQDHAGVNGAADEKPAVNVLGGGMIRKKPKKV
ncbi:histone acetylation protein-domain-containing protein [Neohortaea acidophila]|uniref:histone acetyltransferase n=1 Tax=Neohortaea acidophila TaxID=245834 RepID=A0A6A6PU53_9PEZI|nr:histone acetylation protein-domain-containing protein [Neohortaea acidophila]KAF2483620.1 histone acetylation protein-domain-containing protein [Neohortaea acidophila]